MAIHQKYYSVQSTPNSVSDSKSPDERSLLSVVFQSGKPPVDFEFQLFQEVRQRINESIDRNRFPSGFVRKSTRVDKDAVDYTFIDDPANPGFLADSFYLAKQDCMVAGIPLTIDYTNSASANTITLDPAPQFGGPAPDIKRTDFVFLEVWMSLVAPSPRALGTVTVVAAPNPLDTITINGNVLTAVAGAPGVDEFQIGGTNPITAGNIRDAINDPANSFIGDVYANLETSADVVRIIAQDPGVAGNAITLVSSVPLVLAVSGANLTGGADRSNKPNQSQIYRHGNVLADASVNLDDDLMDDTIAFETAQRVQVQYRIRTTGQSEAVNYITEPHGFENATVLAMGGTLAPVAGYNFVPADKATITGSSSAVAYGFEDPGLWIAGDGTSTSATDLQTLDGFVYAIPIAFVFRKNDAYVGGVGAGFDPENNTNGGAPTTHIGFVNPYVGLIAAGTSDRPDGCFPDAISRTDLMDLRRHVSLTGIDYAAELQWQFKQLLANDLRTWAIDTADEHTLGNGTGDVSVNNLVCDEIGRSDFNGGNGSTSGTTTRGNFIREFDHIARRFGAQPVVERVLFPIDPTWDGFTRPGTYVIKFFGVNWHTGDTIHIDLGSLNVSTEGDFDPATASLLVPPNNIENFMLPGAYISDVISVYHNDGLYAAAVDQRVQLSNIAGVGTNSIVLTLGFNDTLVDGGGTLAPATHPMVGWDGASDDGSPEVIFVELEVTYPGLFGTSETPVLELIPDVTNYPYGAMLENDVTQRPTDMDVPLPPKFREGKREVVLEQACTLITDRICSRDRFDLYSSRRMWGGLTATYEDLVGGGGPVNAHVNTEYGSSSRLLVTAGALSGAGQTMCELVYQPQDAIPNFGAVGGGYQNSIFYRTAAPQTAGAKAGPLTGAGGTLPITVEIKPLCFSDFLWSGQSGVGSAESLAPYSSPIEQFVSANLEEYYNALALINKEYLDLNSGLVSFPIKLLSGDSDSLYFGDAISNIVGRDLDFRVSYPVGVATTTDPLFAIAEEHDGWVRHKNMLPFLGKIGSDGGIFRKGDVVLVVAVNCEATDTVLKGNNIVSSDDLLLSYFVSVYKTKNSLILPENE